MSIVGYISYGVTQTPVIWSSASAQPTPLQLGGGTSGGAAGISDPPTPVPTPVPTPISNICFPAGTPVQTDQGIVNIEWLDTRINTINTQPILHITQTTTLDKYLISFDKHALSRNVPHTKTIMTKDHKIMFEDRMVPAYRFLDYSKQVKKVKYNGEMLYNVLLAEHSLMNVNNIVCETLHPENIIAKLYLTNYTEQDREIIVEEMNTSLKKRNIVEYKAVVNKLTYNM